MAEIEAAIARSALSDAGRAREQFVEPGNQRLRLDRHAFARERRLVDRRAARRHRAVYGQVLAGAHADGHAHAHLRQRHLALGAVGTLIGAVAGYVGGVWDEIIMRLTELFMAFPTIILAMAVTAALGPDATLGRH